jgi:large subunit ribosomal protein L1
MSKKIVKIQNRSKKYSQNQATIVAALGSEKMFSVEDAAKLLFTLEQPTFKDGASVELHLNLNINPTKSDQLVRSSVSLPHGTGKEIKIAAFVSPENVDLAIKAGAFRAGSEDLVNEIKMAGKVDFDIAVAQPDMMKKLPVIARILGTAGVMPNPKTGTVSDDIADMIKIIKAGKVDYKNDKTGNIHIPCGKINSKFTPEQIIENVKAAIDSVEKAKPDAIKKKYIVSVYLTTTMSPSLKIG